MMTKLTPIQKHVLREMLHNNSTLTASAMNGIHVTKTDMPVNVRTVVALRKKGLLVKLIDHFMLYEYAVHKKARELNCWDELANPLCQMWDMKVRTK